MSTTKLTRTFKIDGVLTDMTSVKLSDSTATFGVKRNDTDAVVVADNTSWTKISTGYYEYDITDPAYDLEYTVALEFVYDGETYREEYVVDGTATGEEPVSLTEAKAHLRVDISTDDTLIQSLIVAAREYCEGFQNRTYISTSKELWLDAFPSKDFIEIPLPPLASISSVKYYDTSNVEATMSSGDYFVDTKSEPGRVCLGYGKSWPSTTLRSYNGVCITFVAGYGATAASTPQKVKQAMLLLIGDYYSTREAGNASKGTIEAVERLLWLDRCL